MQQLTIITTYYNDKWLLEEFIKNFKDLKKQFGFLQLIVVDDGSMSNPARDIITKTDDITLYTILEDIGFNSHGARNLGVVMSDTYWNLLIDIDYSITPYDIKQIVDIELDNNTSYFYNVNTFVVNKDVFLSCKGYDEEYYNMHFGDRDFVNYIRKNYRSVDLDSKLIPLRRCWKVVRTNDVTITTYKDGVLYYPLINNEKIGPTKEKVRSRYRDNNFTNKQILNFRWEKTF